MAKIEEIKRKRKDGELTNVIVNEVRNKQLKDYMVRKLPHEFTTVEQFEYLNQT
jgi:U3 small nucleolar RNA-associated protein 14